MNRASQTSIRFKPDLLKRARFARIEQGISFQDLVERALEQYLAGGTNIPTNEQAPLGENSIPIPDILGDNLVKRLRAMVLGLAEIVALKHGTSKRLAEAALHNAADTVATCRDMAKADSERQLADEKRADHFSGKTSAQKNKTDRTQRLVGT